MSSRRGFLTGALASSATLLVAACSGVSISRPTGPPVEISLLQWNHFIPTADPFFAQQAAEYGRQSNVKVTVETVNANDLLPRFISALNAQSGPSIFQTQHMQVHLLADGL